MRKRDEEFTVFVEQASASLLRTAWFLTGDVDTAKELVQASLVKVYLAWSRVDPSTATAYARKVLVNQARDAWKKAGREVPTDGEHAVQECALQIHDGAEHDDVVEGAALIQALRLLPHQQREVVVLRYYCDRSVDEVADTLGISHGAVKSAASRGLTALRKHYLVLNEESR